MTTRLGLICEAIAAMKPGPAGQTNAGRWVTNTGAVMAQWFPNMNPEGITLVAIDLASVITPDNLSAKDEHWGQLIGRWNDPQVITAGEDRGIYYSLTLYTESDDDTDLEKDALRAAARWSALMKRDHPIEASIGEDTRESDCVYERVMPGTSVDLNGQTYTAPVSGPPLVIARNLKLGEISLVEAGADHGTQRIAATVLAHVNPTNPQKGTTMSEQLKALLAAHPKKYHGVVANSFAEGADEAAIAAAVHAAVIKDKDAEIARLKASLAAAESAPELSDAPHKKDETVQGEDDDDKEKVDGEDDDDDDTVQASNAAVASVRASKKPAGGRIDNTDDDAPKDALQARKIVAKETGLKGRALMAATVKQYPQFASERLAR